MSRRSASSDAAIGAVTALQRAGLETLSDAGTRGMYASDASLYRIPPVAVVRPRHVDEVAAALAVARETGVPITARGAGTSVAGNAVGRGIVLDFSRHLNRVLPIDPDSRTASVEPGTVHAVLQKAAMAHGIRFGPDPTTHPRCTIGGMIGNNACGARSLAYGRTSDNVAGLELLTASGDRFATGYDAAGSPFVSGADAVFGDVRSAMSRRHLATARTELDRFGRQVSGYAAHHLLPERFDPTQALVGSEGTLAVITRATVRLVVDPPMRVVVVFGFRDIVAAGEAAPAVVGHRPTSCEGLDSRLLEVLRARRGPGPVPPRPRGGAWLFVELAGDDRKEVLSRARQLAADETGDDALVIADPATPQSAAVAHPRGRRRSGGPRAVGQARLAGWEDAAVPPDQLGKYLARFDELVASHGMTSAPFDHFGEGCMHVRLDVPLDQPDGTHVLREFLTEARGSSVSSAGRCPVNTATGAPARPCCRTYTPPTRSPCSRASSTPSTLATSSTRASWSTRTRSTPRSGQRAPFRSGGWRWPIPTTAAISARLCTAAPVSTSAVRTTLPPVR